MKRIKEQDEKITIGSDPEFCFWDTNNNYHISAIRLLRDKVGVHTDYMSSDVEIGVDGAQDTGELRPKAGDTPEEHFNNIKNLFEKLQTLHSAIDVVGNTRALGAHIHIGGIKKDNDIYNVVKLFDIYLGRKFIQASGFARAQYKKLGKYETKRYGFEYRSLPAIILLDPKLLQIVLKLAFNIAKSYMAFEEIEETSNLKNLQKFITKEEAKYYVETSSILRNKLERNNFVGNTFKYWFNEEKITKTVGIDMTTRNNSASSSYHNHYVPRNIRRGTIRTRDVIFNNGDIFIREIKELIRYHPISSIVKNYYGIRSSADRNIWGCCLEGVENIIQIEGYSNQYSVKNYVRKSRHSNYSTFYGNTIGIPYHFRNDCSMENLVALNNFLDLVYERITRTSSEVYTGPGSTIATDNTAIGYGALQVNTATTES